MLYMYSEFFLQLKRCVICKILRQKDPHFLSFKEWAYQKLKTKLQYYKKKLSEG